MAKRKRKYRSRKAKRVRARKTVTRARRARATYRANSMVKQPFTALQNGFSSFINYFK